MNLVSTGSAAGELKLHSRDIRTLSHLDERTGSLEGRECVGKGGETHRSRRNWRENEMGKDKGQIGKREVRRGSHGGT